MAALSDKTCNAAAAFMDFIRLFCRCQNIELTFERSDKCDSIIGIVEHYFIVFCDAKSCNVNTCCAVYSRGWQGE